MCIINERFVVTPATPEVAVTVEQVYGKPLCCLKPPKGYEFLAFRIPCSNIEECMSASSHQRVYGRDVWGLNKVRLILKKKEPHKVVKHVFTETGECRPVDVEEYYTVNGQDGVFRCVEGITLNNYRILKYERIEETVED